MKSTVRLIPKAELHVHIEGTLHPAMARELAARNGVTLEPALFSPDGGEYRYKDFLDLVTKVYQAIACCMKTKADYEQATYGYLRRCADESAIYAELIGCPGQCARSGISYRDMVDGMAAGIDRARADCGVEARINMTFERHRPGNEADKDAGMILSYPHPYIVGLDIAGGEREGDIPQFKPLFDRVQDGFGRKLGLRMHAGEGAGPAANIRAALDFGVTRIGHGVRLIEDPGLMEEIIARGVVLEVCPTSNILLMRQYGGDFANHPLRRLYDAGVKVTLNSDDPGLFGAGCSIGGEYAIAHDKFGFSDQELMGITRTAVDAAYIADSLRRQLLAKVC
jgi:adenosine deaminase